MTNQNIEFFPPLVDPQNLQPLLPCDTGLCSKSGANYQVLSGIPRVVPNLTNYADAFGEQWKRWRLTQLDSHTGTSITADRVNRCLGDELVNKLSGQGEIQILEAGCGAGRFTEVLLSYQVVRLTSSDLSSAVESNQINFPQDHRHRIVQCDICLAPFKPGSFDVVVCLGVIQHTPNPELTIQKLFEQVKPNGWLVIDHYAPSFKYYTKITAMLLRPILKRLSPSSRMRACEILTSIFFPAHKLFRHVPLAQKLLSRVSPLLTYFHELPQLNNQLQYEWALLDTQDSLTDWYKHLRTTTQIESTLNKLGAVDIHVVPGGNGVEARCRKVA